MKTKRLTTIAILAAVYVVLAFMTPVKLVNFKFTFEAFPILIAGFLMGKMDGLLVGLLGSGIYQILFSGYGITPSTPLWILPHAFSGFMVGLLSEKVKGELDTKKIVSISALSAVCVTLLNTLALYADSKLYGYYSAKLVFGSLLWKFAAGLVLSFVYALILPELLKRLKQG